MHRRLRQSRQNLLRSSEIELRQFRENDKADVKDRHCLAPLVLKRTTLPVGQRDPKAAQKSVSADVRFGSKAESAECPLYPQKRTSTDAPSMSALCQKRT